MAAMTPPVDVVFNKEDVIDEIAKKKENNVPKAIFEKLVDQLADSEFAKLFTAIQNTELKEDLKKEMILIDKLVDSEN